MGKPLKRLFRQPVDDVLAALEPIVLVRSPLRALGPFMLALIAAWFIYVPIHELLHVLGCELAGGDVTRLEIAPKYGGALWARVFPFVVSGGDYAGRLSGFDWKGSDATYLVTDFMPYVLTVLIGVPLIKLSRRRRRPILFAVGVVVGLAPFYSLPGDYYEMGSIVTTRAITFVTGPSDSPARSPSGEPAPAPSHVSASGASSLPPADPSAEPYLNPAAETDAAFGQLRSDDIFLLLSKLFTNPDELNLRGPAQITIGLLVIIASAIAALLLALLTYALGHLFSSTVLRA